MRFLCNSPARNPSAANVETMTTSPNLVVVDFLIEQARSRSNKYSTAAPLNGIESVAIFDELDSLTAEEFSAIYVLYLLGSGAENNSEYAKRTALAAAFAPLEGMANDIELHTALVQGLKKWHQHASHS